MEKKERTFSEEYSDLRTIAIELNNIAIQLRNMKRGIKHDSLQEVIKRMEEDRNSIANILNKIASDLVNRNK